jgi:myo-inositol-1(or 4)-monophosphatase
VTPPSVQDVAIAAACAGGRVLMELRRETLEVSLKDARANLVTSADLRAQAAVTAVLREAFPDHAVVGEEGTVGDPNTEQVWFVDPLDGTTNYAHGLPFFDVSVALRDRTGTVCGVVCDPYHDELFVASRGAGATLNGRPLSVSAVDRLDRALVVTQAQSSDPEVIGAFARLLEALMNASRGVRFPGAPALVLCAIAAGRLEAYCERDMDPWDISAGTLILEEAGGRMTRFDGTPVESVEPADVVATNGRIHVELVDALATLEARERTEAA